MIKPLPSDPRYLVSDDGTIFGIKGQPLKGCEHNGYILIRLTKNCRSRAVFAHRLVLETFVGPCPDGMETLHRNGIRSDNRLVNLRYGTRSENMFDAREHGTHPMASRTECYRGHAFTEENTYIHPGQKGSGPFRMCRTCRREKQRAYRAANGYQSPSHKNPTPAQKERHNESQRRSRARARVATK